MASNLETAAEQKIKLEMSFKRDSSGIWNLDIQSPCNFSSIVSCLLANKNDAFNFKGLIKEAKPEDEKANETLWFQVRGGRESAVSACGSTAFAFGNDYFNTWAMTNRTLEVDELFEVKLNDQVVAETNPTFVKRDAYGRQLQMPKFCIGVTTVDPASIDEKLEKRPTGWYWSGKEIYKNEQIMANIGNALPKVGDRIGVLQDESGKLHFFLNGVDQGVYTETLPYPTYGCIQFGPGLRAASILNSCTTYGYLLKLNAKK